MLLPSTCSHHQLLLLLLPVLLLLLLLPVLLLLLLLPVLLLLLLRFKYKRS